MKYTFLFLLCSLFAQAQTTTVTKTFVKSADSTNYFEVVRETNDVTGAWSEHATLVGPASALSNDQADKIEQRMQTLANAAFTVSYTSKRINEEKAVAATILALTGISPLAVIQARYKDRLLTAGWTIDPGTGFVPLVFTENAQGVLRYSVNGAATKAADVYGNIIRLNNYPSNGTDTEFFRNEDGGQYFSLPKRAIKIKKP